MVRNGLGVATALVAAALASSPAYATVIDLRAPTSTSGGTNNGNSMTYVIGSGANQLQLRATAWSIDTSKSPDVVTNAILRSYSGGLGVQNQGETNASPDHSVDNSDGWIDFVMLQFDKKVDLNSFYVGWYSGDADATIRWGNTSTAWNVNPISNGQSISVLDGLMTGQLNSDKTSNFTGWRDLDIPTMSNTYIISSRSPTNANTDYFKVSGVNVQPVPEPATWMAMLVGFGAIGVAQRRRRPAAKLAALESL